MMTETFATLWKGLNTIAVAPTAPLINTPKGASPDLIRQANKKIGKGQDRKAILGQLRTSTRKAPAAVIAPPALPDPSSPTTQSGFGGGGYSGNNAVRLGQSSNTGFSQALPPEPSLGKGLGSVLRAGGKMLNNGLFHAENAAERAGGKIGGRLAGSSLGRGSQKRAIHASVQSGKRAVAGQMVPGFGLPKGVDIRANNRLSPEVNRAMDAGVPASRASVIAKHKDLWTKRGKAAGAPVLRGSLIAGVALGAKAALTPPDAAPTTALTRK